MMTSLEAPYAVSKLLTGMKEMVDIEQERAEEVGGVLPGTLPDYQTGTAGGSSAEGEEYSPGYTQYD